MMRRSTLALVALTACAGDPAPSPPAEAADTGLHDDPAADGCLTDAEQYARDVAPLVQSDCASCHVAGGAAGGTRQVLEAGDSDAVRAANRAVFAALVTDTEDGAELLLTKPTGQTSHGGGARFDLLDPPYAALHELVARVQEPGACAHPGEPPLTCDGTPRPGPTPLRRLTDVQVDNAIVDVFDVALPPDLFPATARNADFRTFASNNTVSALGAESIQLTAEAVSAAIDVEAALACGAPPEDCARDQLLAWADALYRRPLTEAEAALVLRFADAGLPAEDALRMGVEVLVQSPQFLYLAATAAEEVDPETGVARLDDHAIAARLAFFLTDRPPDGPLRAAADAGELHTRAQARAHALRLVAGPLAAPVVARFHRDWLDLYRFDGHFKDPDLYPLWSEDLVAAMGLELDLYTTEVVWMGDGRFDTLMFGTTTWVNPDLAAIYGLPDPGPGWHRVTLDAETRPGLLTRAGFLASHAYAATSSPVSRGAWVLEELLCEDLNPPSDINMDLPAESEEAPTIRERLEQHWTDPSCSACHDRIDPIGFAFEHYDALGAWRASWESGVAVDATGELEDPAGRFDGAAELISLVGSTDRAKACYAERWFEYAVGRPAHAQDACSLRALSDRFVETDGDLRALLVDVAMTDAFLLRAPAEEAP